MNTREKVLKEALNCVNGEREKQYGNPEDNFKRIADLWSDYLSMLFDDVCIELEPIDVAKMMVLFKIARSMGSQDKLDNYVDMIGYAACAAEILERDEELSDTFEEVAPGTYTNKEEFEKYVNAYHRRNGKTNMQGAYSYYHDKLANYVSAKAKEEHIPLESLKDINRKFPRELEELLDLASTDCVINGKQLIDCYNEIDELFAKYKPDIKKYNSFWDAYENVSEYIASSSHKANVDERYVIGCLVENGNVPTKMAALLWDGKLNFDDVAAYVEDAINEVKKETKNANNN